MTPGTGSFVCWKNGEKSTEASMTMHRGEDDKTDFTVVTGSPGTAK